MKSTRFFILSQLTFSSLLFADETAQGQQSGGTMGSMLFIGLIFIIFYFLMIRPQNKRTKEHRELISRLAKGDEVITSGGMLGKINRTTDNFFILYIRENIEIPVQKQAITTALPKGTIKSL